MPEDLVDCVVIGAGVVGLALARELARSGREVVIIERENAFGSGISSRNSEVIHAGLYYATGSHKARLSVRGRELLYAYCDQHHVETRRCGKLVVATDESQLGTLHKIAAQAARNGVDDCKLLEGDEAMRLEPELFCHAALHSPSTGVVDSHGLMLSLLGEAEEAGAMIAYQSDIGKLVGGKHGMGVCLAGETEPLLNANLVINAAGLGALPLLERSGFNIPLPTQVFAKGNYFKLDAPPPVSRLIYPVPETGGLGVHITLDLAGRARFGPDVEWLDSVTPETLDYTVDERRADVFYAAIRHYWPGLPDHSLLADYAGVRPKISIDETVQTDFYMQGPHEHGVSGLVNLLGIESPGLTSALAIAEYAAQQLID